MKKILILSSVIGGILLLILMAMIGYILLAPQVIIDDKMLAVLNKLDHDKFFHFQNAKLIIQGRTLPNKRISFTAERLELHFADFDLTAQAAEFTVDVALHFPKPSIIAWGPIRSSVVTLTLHPAAPASNVSKESTLLTTINQLSTTKCDEIAIESFKFKTSGPHITHLAAQGTFHLSGFNKHRSETLTFSMSRLRGMKITAARGQISLRADQPNLITSSKVMGDAKVTLRRGGNSWATKLSFTKSSGGLLTAAVAATGRVFSIKSSFHGAVNAHEVTGQLMGLFSLHQPLAAKARLANCSVRIIWQEGLSLDRRLKLLCHGSLTRKIRADHELFNDFGLLPTEIPFEISSDTSLQNATNSVATTTTVRLRSQSSIGSPLAVDGYGTLQGVMSLDSPNLRGLPLSFGADIVVDGWERITAKLVNTPLAIPAPLNQLAGKVGCHISTNRLEIPITSSIIYAHCSTDLKSSGQTLVLGGTGTIKLEKDRLAIRSTADFQVEIYSVDFVLPHLKLGTPLPNLIVDPRIVVDQSGPAHKLPIYVSYNVIVKTHTQGAVRLHTNLIGEPVPLSVYAQISDRAPTRGQITVKDWKVNLLRRDTVVHDFILDFGQNQLQQPIHGKIVVQDNQYIITIGLLGTLEKPRYFLESQPPLAEKDLLAVLLFGQNLNALDSDKMESVENTRAALADGVINLLSMYYLASTPIERISYNYATKMVSASFRVAKRVSLIVGTNTENLSEVGISKNLGHGWSIETKGIEDQTTGTSEGAAMLRWRYRY